MLRRFFLLFAVVTSTACAHNLAPTEDALLTNPVSIVAPVLEEDLGALALIEDGRWAFQTGDDATSPEWERGQIVAFGDLDEQRRHLFVVISTHSWGGFLQRIDNDPVDVRRSGSLVPLARLDRQVAKRWGVCAGTGDPTVHPCIEDAPIGTRWDIYPADGPRLTLVEDSGDALVLPARRGAQLHTSSTGATLLGEVPPGWIAVPRVESRPPARSLVLAHPNCRGKIDDDTPMVDIEVRDFAPPETFFETEAVAYETGSDGFVHCDDDDIVLHVPGLTRRGWTRAGGKAVGPFLSAFAPHKLAATPATVPLALQFIGSLGAGDIAAADFWLERLLLVTDDDSMARLGRDAMQVTVEAGRVEGAVRQGSQSTSAQWNRENDPRWGLGFAAVEDALGRTREFVERRSELEKRASRAKDDEVLAAIYWYQAVETLGATGGMPAVEKLTAALTKRELGELKPAVVWRATERGWLTPEKAIEAVTLDERGRLFIAAAAGDVTPLECTEGDCHYDVYGRRFLGKKELSGLSDKLLHVGTSDFAPGYAARLADVEDPEILVALLPLVDDRRGVRDTLVEFAVNCDADADGALALARELPDDASASWFLGAGRRAFCKDLSSLIAVSKEWIGDRREVREDRRRVVSAMIDRRLFRMKDGLEMAKGASFLAELGGQTGACERWNVALAVAHLRAGRTESANDFTETALSCERVGEISTRMAAFVNFDRTRSVSSSFEPPVRRAVEVAARRIVPGDACVATEPEEWDWGQIVTERMESVVRAIEVPPAEEDAVMLATATRTLESAERTRAELLEAMKALDAPAVHEAMSALETDYAAIDYKPGIRRAEFMRRHLVGEDPAEGEEATPPKKRTERFKAWSAPTDYIVSDEGMDEIVVALSFMIEPRQEWPARVEALEEDARQALCGIPEDET